MNPMTGWIVALAFLVISIAVVYVYFKTLKDKNKEISQLKNELNKQKEVTVELYKHAAEIAKIEKQKDKTNQKINEAKTDEEIIDIINSVIDANNDRVRK